MSVRARGGKGVHAFSHRGQDHDSAQEEGEGEEEEGGSGGRTREAWRGHALDMDGLPVPEQSYLRNLHAFHNKVLPPLPNHDLMEITCRSTTGRGIPRQPDPPL